MYTASESYLSQRSLDTNANPMISPTSANLRATISRVIGFNRLFARFSTDLQPFKLQSSTGEFQVNC
jgi:hypothetical protein